MSEFQYLERGNGSEGRGDSGVSPPNFLEFLKHLNCNLSQFLSWITANCKRLSFVFPLFLPFFILLFIFLIFIWWTEGGGGSHPLRPPLNPPMSSFSYSSLSFYSTVFLLLPLIRLLPPPLLLLLFLIFLFLFFSFLISFFYCIYSNAWRGRKLWRSLLKRLCAKRESRIFLLEDLRISELRFSMFPRVCSVLLTLIHK